MRALLTKIGDCARVLPGYALKARAEHEPGGTHQVIMGKHLSDELFYVYSPEQKLRISPSGSMDKYLVRAGDVLFISRGTRNHAAVVESVPDPTVASATFFILRPRREVDPTYLAWCLNQLPIQAHIAQVRTSAGTPIVQRKVFSDIVIPIPSPDKQRMLAEVGALMEKEIMLRKELVSQTEQLHRAAGRRLLKRMVIESRLGDENED